ncbi:Receptor-type tyrosine-protein phosphatase U [Nymphon striatum]|nr:Receptor-type tyrosine-protein phosphatase U [Nymphon striatum]
MIDIFLFYPQQAFRIGIFEEERKIGAYGRYESRAREGDFGHSKDSGGTQQVQQAPGTEEEISGSDAIRIPSFHEYEELMKLRIIINQMVYDKVDDVLISRVEEHSTRHAGKEANELKNHSRGNFPYPPGEHSLKLTLKVVAVYAGIKYILKGLTCSKATAKKMIKPINEDSHYDYNRVVLDSEDGVPDSDYINASYMDSILKPNAYIATQGKSNQAKKHLMNILISFVSFNSVLQVIVLATGVDQTEYTIGDFWRMMWQQNCYVIVMLTKVFDFIRVMCSQYWPAIADKPELYGNLEITLLDEEELANVTIRTIKIKNGNEEREVIQLHYKEWPDHSCTFSNALLEFRRRVRVYMKKHPLSPTVVHCSDGCGRTGVYICLDANLELAEEDSMYDVFGYARRLRAARRGMIENLSQYKFIYDTLEEGNICGASWFPVSELSRQLKFKSMKDPVTKQNEYQKEYEKICRMTSKFSIGDCAGGHRLENRDKNRDVAIVPPDNFRPYLSSFQSNDNTDYINAVFVDGYTKSKEYIVTEWPYKSTCMDFWSMVYDHDCNTVVVLGSPPSSNDEWCEELEAMRSRGEQLQQKRPAYRSVVVVGSVVQLKEQSLVVCIRTSELIRVEDEQLNGQEDVKEDYCNSQDEKCQKHTYPPFWPDKEKKKKYGPVFTVELVSSNHYPNVKTWIFRLLKKGYKVPTSTNAVVELMNMVERWRQRTNYGPVVVVSTNGKCRAGVYCAANVAIEQVVQHKEVDVFQAVKTVRRHRPQLVDNMVYRVQILLRLSVTLRSVLPKQQNMKEKSR